MSMTFAVLGDGAWGTAIALLLAQNATHRVRLWSARSENGLLLEQHRENVHLLPGVPIPPAVELTRDIRRAVAGADVWVSAIPTVYLRPTLTRILSELGPGAALDVPVVSLSKGIEKLVEFFSRLNFNFHEAA